MNAETRIRPKIRKWRRQTAWERFQTKIRIAPNGCWIWFGEKEKHGYGRLTVGRVKVMAHRYAYQTLIGPLPQGLQCDHVVCQNPSCVNPYHLEPVTPKINTLRGNGVGGQNHRKTHCAHGHAYDLENTRICKDGSRSCRECARAACRQWRRTRKKG